MKLLLDDKATRGYDLNANEACIFAAILKCTRAGRGWYGNYRELAAAMPFVMSHETARRAVQKLLNLGLIERREEKLFALTQIVTDGAQNVTESTQNVTSDAQNVFPPNNPPKNNNMNEEKREGTCTHTCDTPAPETPFFLVLHSFFIKKGGTTTPLQMEAAKDAWQKCSDVKKRQLIEAVKSGAHFKPRLDWLIADFPEPQPTFLSGQEQDRLREQGIPLVQVKYNGKFLICTRATMELFGLEWVCDWLPKRD
jgi:hypothetical protein